MKKHPRIIFFIEGTKPTPIDEMEAAQCGTNVVFRNALMISPEGCLEPCEGVAGAVPENYKEAFPTAEEALEAYGKKQEEYAAFIKSNAEKLEAAKAKQAEEAKAEKEKQKDEKPAKGWEPNA